MSYSENLGLFILALAWIVVLIIVLWHSSKHASAVCCTDLLGPGVSFASCLAICLLAFNVNKQNPSMNEANRIFDLFDKQFKHSQKPEVYAVALTELKYNSNAYRNEMKSLMKANGYEQLDYVRNMRTSLGVFVQKEQFLKYTDVKHQSMRLDSILKPTLVHKAACNITFRYNDVSFSFVGAHLSAHAEGNQKRIKEYGKVMKDFKLDHDYQFWMGDLNFRLEGLSYEEVGDSIRKKDWDYLVERDQLKLAQQDKKAFTGFREGQIDFAPTFKFDIGSEEYSRKRTPAYTDRILFKNLLQKKLSASKENLVEVDMPEYRALHEVNLSDHKPVRALAMIPNEAFLVKKCLNSEHLDMGAVSGYKGKSMLLKFGKLVQVLGKCVT